jgi:hypothetical protein
MVLSARDQVRPEQQDHSNGFDQASRQDASGQCGRNQTSHGEKNRDPARYQENKPRDSHEKVGSL